MKQRSFFYALVLTSAWGACVVLAALFAGGQRLHLLPLCMPGVLILLCLPWTGNLASGNLSQYMVPAGVTLLAVFVLGLSMDWLQVRTVVWKRTVGGVTLCLASAWALVFLWKSLLDRSFASAAHSVGFDEWERLVSCLLFCLASGLLLGSILGLINAGLERILKSGNRDGLANGSQPNRSETNRTSSAVDARH